MCKLTWEHRKSTSFEYGFCDGNVLLCYRRDSTIVWIPSVQKCFQDYISVLFESGTVREQPDEVGHVLSTVGVEELIVNDDPEIDSRKVARVG